MSGAATRRPRRPSKAEVDEAVSQIEAWGSADHSAGYDPNLHSAVGRLLLAMEARPASPMDPFLIAMA